MPSPTRRRIKEIAYAYQNLLRKHKGYPVKCFGEMIRRESAKSAFWKSFIKLFLLTNHFRVKPELWLEIQFRRFPSSRLTPLPTMMCSEAAIDFFLRENPQKLSFTKKDSQRLFELYDEILGKLEEGGGLA